MAKGNRYSREEKIAMLQLITDGGCSVHSVANEYGIHENTLWKWRRQYKADPEAAFTPESSAGSKLTEEERLRRRVKELEAEVTFLKKVSAYFAKNPQ